MHCHPSGVAELYGAGELRGEGAAEHRLPVPARWGSDRMESTCWASCAKHSTGRDRWSRRRWCSSTNRWRVSRCFCERSRLGPLPRDGPRPKAPPTGGRPARADALRFGQPGLEPAEHRVVDLAAGGDGLFPLHLLDGIGPRVQIGDRALGLFGLLRVEPDVGTDIGAAQQEERRRLDAQPAVGQRLWAGEARPRGHGGTDQQRGQDGGRSVTHQPVPSGGPMGS